MAEPDGFLNALEPDAARAALLRCCGSTRWAERMLRRRPFRSPAALYAAADRLFVDLERADLLEAFAAHPQIGADIAALEAQFGGSAAWSRSEQAGVAAADMQTLEALRDMNVAYAERFGFTFIVCATGKSAEEMLALLRSRLHNEPATELAVAAAEQAKITRLRLEKLAP
jgi:2-oxo-4-hydroxy-4-carboxy-5-ureidoimidazoline decarboxylase